MCPCGSGRLPLVDVTKVALHPHMREAKPDSTHGEPPNRAGRTKSMPKYTQPAKPNRKPLTTPHPPTSVGVRDGPSPRLTDGPPIGGVRLEICRLRSLEFLTLDPFWTTAILSLQCVVLHGSKCESTQLHLHCPLSASSSLSSLLSTTVLVIFTPANCDSTPRRPLPRPFCPPRAVF